MRQALMLLVALVAICALLAADDRPTITRLDGSTIRTAEIDEIVTRLMKAAEVTGAGIAVINEGKIAYLKAYGFRDKDKNLPLTVDSVMSAASFTKVAFAYVVMELVDAKALDLDRPVYQYLPKPLPDYPQYADLASDPRYKQITARMLLSHTSGFANWRAFEDDHKLKIHFVPGSRYAYSGEGIDLLQLLVETILKGPLEELMRERLFKPLGMSRTAMVWQERFESDYANGYDQYGRLLGPQKRSHADAAGSMLTTVADFASFVQAVMTGTLLGSDTREQMLSPQIQILSKHQFPTFANETTDENRAIRLSYGLAWGLYWTPYGKAFFKEGHDDGWRNYTVCFDTPKAGLVVMTNSGNGEGIFQELMETILKNTFTPTEWEGYTPYDKLPVRAPVKQHKQVAVDSKLLDRYAGRYGDAAKLVLTVHREGDHLSIQENDEPRQDLLPESETDFFSTVSTDVFTFEMDRQGHPIRVVLHVDGKDVRIKRIE
jgi:CubicO group peptidase (beta-lactamase class C family)